jgi:pyridoxamine 5'-phosphate oxidase
MSIHECIQFANENKICYLATAVGDQPKVRALGFWFADETGFYFQTSTIKEFTREMENNPKIEVCFYQSKGTMGMMLRITGIVEFLNDERLKEKVLEDRPFLKNFGLSLADPRLVIFRIPHGKAHFWTMENNLKPKDFVDF